MRGLSTLMKISGNPTWQQTMLRIKNPSAVDYYTQKMGMTLIDTYKFDSFSLFFLATMEKPYLLKPGSTEAHQFLWSFPGTTLELTHNHGTESNPDFKYHAGNEEGDGFGHICFNCEDVYSASSSLEADGVKFKKRPDEGRMKGLAFAYDDDGYWVELVKRSETTKFVNQYNLSQTMLRVKDAKKSISFYESLGMNLLRENHFDSFSLYFMATLLPGATPPPSDSPEARDYVKSLYGPVLELTHNHGTEAQPDFEHKNGNEEGKQGFGHIGFLVDDVNLACSELAAAGATFRKEPNGGKMKGLAFVLDPDGYSVEIIKRGGYDDEATTFFY